MLISNTNFQRYKKSLKVFENLYQLKITKILKFNLFYNYILMCSLNSSFQIFVELFNIIKRLECF